MELSEAAIAAIKMALEPAVRLIGERSAEMAALIILGHGIDSAHMPLEDIMVVGATARIGSLAAMGFFNYVPLEEGLSLAADHIPEAHRDPAITARIKKAGLIYDALILDLHNFTPVYQMIDSVLSENNKDLAFPPVLELKPCSEGAIRWAQELDSPLRYATPSFTHPQEELKPLAAKVALETIKEKEMITEGEAAALLSCSIKSLGNRRRNNEINRSVFIQGKANGKVLYYRAALLAAIRNNTLFVTTKNGKK